MRTSLFPLAAWQGAGFFCSPCRHPHAPVGCCAVKAPNGGAEPLERASTGSPTVEPKSEG